MHLIKFYCISSKAWKLEIEKGKCLIVNFKKKKTKQVEKNAFVCNLYRFPWYEYFHHGQCQTTNMMPECRVVNPFESALAHHWVFQFIKDSLVNHNYNCRISTWIWHILWGYNWLTVQFGFLFVKSLLWGYNSLRICICPTWE